MKSWPRVFRTDGGIGIAANIARRARLGALTGAILPPVSSAIAIICLTTLFVSSAQAQYTSKNLVSDTSLYSPVNRDPNLIDGWGLAALPDSPWWLSAQNTSTSPLYTAGGSIESLVVDIPCVTNNATGATTAPCPFPGEGYIDEPNNPSNMMGNTSIGPFGIFGPTGIVANTFAKAFEVSGAPAQFLFATQDGLIVAWNQNVSPSTQGAVVANQFSASSAPLYQGLAIAGPATNPHLYAANAAGGIDVYNNKFALVNTFFPEPNLATTNPAFEPAGPYGIQAIGD